MISQNISGNQDPIISKDQEGFFKSIENANDIFEVSRLLSETASCQNLPFDKVLSFLLKTNRKEDIKKSAQNNLAKPNG